MTQAPAAVDPGGGRAGVRVLLVDDQQIIGETVRRMLAGHADIELQHCLDPTRALEAARALAPTVILLDLVMPVVDGLTLLRFFRAHDATRRVPIVVLSAKEDAVTKAEAFEAGANDYLVKLPDALEVVARVRHHSAVLVAELERDAALRALEASHEVLARLNDELEVRNRFIQSTFGRYLNDDVVDELLHHPKGLDLGGEKRVVTILLSDLRGFTGICERLDAEQVVRLLNLYLGAMADVIARHGGTIDEFLGDSILAIFGAPIARDDDAERAVACALAMQGEMEGVNAQLVALGLPEVEMGIGLNTGAVVVGNIGSMRRAKYGVVGSHVNLAARIESSTVGGQVLVSEHVLAELGSTSVALGEELSVQAKGFKDPIVVHEVIAIGGARAIRLASRDRRMVGVEPAVPVLVWSLEGKHVSTEARPAGLVGVGPGTARLRCEGSYRVLDDVKVVFGLPGGETLDAPAYAKVTRGWDAALGTIDLSFTSVPDAVRALLSNLQAGGG